LGLNTTVERDPMHNNQNGRDPDALRASLGTRTELLAQPPAQVVLLDDVLTTGCSFKVCKAMLAQAWPSGEIYGIFIARRVIDRTSPFEDCSASGPL
jgi:predicted amidophosphoribosyltransferase